MLQYVGINKEMYKKVREQIELSSFSSSSLWRHRRVFNHPPHSSPSPSTLNRICKMGGSKRKEEKKTKGYKVSLLVVLLLVVIVLFSSSIEAKLVKLLFPGKSRQRAEKLFRCG